MLFILPVCLSMISMRVQSHDKPPTQYVACEAYTLYKESGNQSLRGSRAVLDTLVNRMAVSGNTCSTEVALPRQFSWHIGKHQKFNLTKQMLDRYLAVIYISPVLSAEYKWFYSSHIAKPKWAYRMKCRKIDSQYFCRE